MQRALILEDLPDSQRWLKAALEEGFPGIAVTLAASLAEARAALAAAPPFDLALVDLALPDGSGVELIAALHRHSPATRCVVTTIFDDDHHLFGALRAGAHGYLLKDQPRAEIVRLLQGVLADEPPLSPAVARRLLAFFHPPRDGGEAALSPRESEVLALIAKGYSVARVGELLGISYHTAAGYVKEIYRKLGVGSRAEATLEAARLGLVQPAAH